MANTTNLNLARPEPTENWSVQNHFNTNMQKIDEFAGNANRAVITNQYSNIVDAINAFRTVKTFPFTIQKSGNASYGGLPSIVSATCEWNALCIGDAQRLTVILVVYTGAGSNNLTVWDENLYNGSVNMSWQQLTKGDTDASVTKVSLSSNSYFEYRKVNGIVHVRARYDAANDGAISAWAAKSLGSLPTGYRPALELTERCSCDREVASRATCATITTGGTVRIDSKWLALDTTQGNIVYANFAFVGV